jgi:hypothetical protein
MHVLWSLLEACPTGAIRHSQEFEGASYNPAGLVRISRRHRQNLYKPKKGGETEPKLVTKVEIGLKYLDEFATPDGGAQRRKARRGGRQQVSITRAPP